MGRRSKLHGYGAESPQKQQGMPSKATGDAPKNSKENRQKSTKIGKNRQECARIGNQFLKPPYLCSGQGKTFVAAEEMTATSKALFEMLTNN